VVLDPYLQTADVNLDNNAWPPAMQKSRFQLYQEKERETRENPMQRSIRIQEMDGGAE